MDRLVYWIWLSLACTPDSPTFARLLDSFDGAEDIYNATDRQIRTCVGPRVSDCTALCNKDLSRAEQIYEFCMSKKVGIVTYEDDNFPEQLRGIPTPPVLLYYRGRLPDFTKGFRCAIVGMRRLSDYGRKNAFALGYDMGCAGATVVSGMATGIDGVALAGAIASGATTVAVIGSGIDVCYPPEHLRLAQEIVKNGCVLTEYAPGTKPEKYNFPRRNRLISGLSDVTVVVEGNERSGALITARHAGKQGRPIYAFPGNIGADGSQATNLLIKNGARLCTGADDIVRDYADSVPPVLNPFKLQQRREVRMSEVLRELRIAAVTPTDDIFYHAPARRKEKPTISETAKPEPPVAADPSALPNFDKEQLKLYKKIPPEGECSVEDLVEDGMDLKKVMSTLLKLEMSRFVILLPGDRVKRNIR